VAGVRAGNGAAAVAGREDVTAHDEHIAGAARGATVPTYTGAVPQDGHAAEVATAAGAVAIGAGVTSFQ
jgi:uncharacterized protein YcfJ